MSEMMHFAVRKYNELGEYLQNYTMKCNITYGFNAIYLCNFTLTKGIYLDSRCFDKLDFIFIDGDKTYKPWAVSSKPLISLLKMCCQVLFFICYSRHSSKLNRLDLNAFLELHQ